MFRFLRDAVRRLGRDERGNVFVLFGASIIPLVLIMGGAVVCATQWKRLTRRLVLRPPPPIERLAD